MLLKKWEDLPDFMRVDEVRPYYDSLKEKTVSLILKRAFDLLGGFILLIVLAIPMAIIAILIKLDSKGPIFYRQERITTYGKHFRIHKFRTMVNNADKIGTAVTIGNDTRITRIGVKLRGFRMDELPQVLDLLSGNMSFVGTRRSTDSEPTCISGTNGEDATVLRIDSSRGTVFKNNAVSTVLSAVIYHGKERITDIDALHRVFGNGAYLQWSWQRMDDERFGVISSADTRLQQGGFAFLLSADDVDTKVTFMCELITD